jgi:hypothetical protein
VSEKSIATLEIVMLGVCGLFLAVVKSISPVLLALSNRSMEMNKVCEWPNNN